MEYRLPLAFPYFFPLTTRRLVTFAKENYVERDGFFYRTLMGDQGLFVVGVGQVEPSYLTLQSNRVLSKDELQMVKRIWSTEVDLTEWIEQWEEDLCLREVFKKRLGLHIVLEGSLFECLIKTIVSQQLNTAFASTLCQRLIDYVGDEVEFDGLSIKIFPEADRLAGCSYAELRSLQLNQRKAEYIIDLSRMIVEGELSLEQLRDLPDDEVMEQLVTIRGIGKWTAECFLLFGLGRSDRLPAADIGLRNAIQQVYQLDSRPDENEVDERTRKWAPYRSYLTLYLWDTLST